MPSSVVLKTSCAASIPDSLLLRAEVTSGMDGLDTSDPDAPKILVATTGQDVRGNLVRNLQSHKSQNESIGARHVVVATTQPAVGSLHESLREAASSEDFHLVNVHGREAFADLLYGSSRWARELLGLSGVPSALSAVPTSSRLMSDLPLIGRDSDKQWLADSCGDIVVSGHPASGKTHLLRQFVDQGWLFAVDSDRDRLANAVRDLEPEVIVVDDAHADLDSLRSLRQLRSAIGADFRIAAVTWPGDKDEVAGALAVPEGSILELRLLTRDEILEIVKAMGIAGPVELQRVIVNQSGGRPGLTATLCDYVRNDEIGALLSGKSLLRDFGAIVTGVCDPYLMHVLAVMALAGDEGASLDDVQPILGLNLPDSQNSMARLGHTGVFLITSLTGKATIWPKELRFAAVGGAFFSPNVYLNIPLIPAMQRLDRKGVVGSLVGAALMGAHVPGHTIEDFLISDGSVDDFKGYAQLGRHQASFALKARPKWLTKIAPYSLLSNPSETIPMLLAQAVGDRRPMHSYPDHPLRILEDWVESAPISGDEQLERRRLLANLAARYAANVGEPQVVLQALCLAMNPKLESITADAGSGHRITTRSALVSRECLDGLIELWSAILDSIPASGPDDFSVLYRMLHDWAYGGRSQRPPPDDVREMMRSHTKRMASDLAGKFSHHPGILSEIREFLRRAGFEVSIKVPEVFAVLFPEEHFAVGIEDLDDQVDDLDDQERAWREDARRLAVELEPLGPDRVLDMVRNSIKTAAEAGKGWPDMTSVFIDEIARMTDESFAWAEWAVAENLSVVVVEPLLREARRKNPEQCLPLVLRALDSDSAQAAAVVVVLTANEPFDEELESALEVLPKLWTMRNLLNGVVSYIRSSTSTLRLLLRHPSSRIAEITAVRLWLGDNNPRVPDVLFDDWRSAIVRSPGEEYMLSVVLASDASLFCEWLVAQIESGISSETHEFIGNLDDAFGALSFSQREFVLSAMRGRESFYFASVVAKLVGDHAEVFEILLAMECLFEYHEAGFVSASESKIVVASKAGWSPIQIAQAIASPAMIVNVFHGEESDHWQTWLEYFSTLSESADPSVAAVGQSGCEWMRVSIDKARHRELDEEIYGR